MMTVLFLGEQVPPTAALMVLAHYRKRLMEYDPPVTRIFLVGAKSRDPITQDHDHAV